MPKAKVSDGIVGFRTFQATNGFGKAILLHTLVEALILELFRRNTQYAANSIRGVHDGKGPRETVEDQCSSGFQKRCLRRSSELGR